MEKLSTFSSGLYNTNIKPIESYVVGNQKFNDPNTFILLHDKLGHPRSPMMQRIIEHSNGHPLNIQKILFPNEYPCAACSQGKLIVIPSCRKVTFESPVFLERIHRDICGPIHLPCGPFRYFIVLINISTMWSHISLISTLNVAFARLLAQIIKLRAQFPDYTIKTIRLDNLSGFISQTSVGINVENPIAHTHT